MASAYVEVVLGVALGGTIGVVPAVAATITGGVLPSLSERRFAREILALVSLPVAGILAMGIGVLAWHPVQAPRIVAGGSVVPLVTLYGFEQGTRVGSVMQRDSRRSPERGRPLAGVAVDAIDAASQVTIRPHGAIGTVPGFPELPGELQRAISAEKWRLPADLPLSELETRIERQLSLEYQLEIVDVTVDPRATATVAAAASTSGIARQVPAGHRAVSVSTIVPDNIEPGEEVIVATDDSPIEGIVISSGPRMDPAFDLSESKSTVNTRPRSDQPRRESIGHEPDRSDGLSRLTLAVPTDLVDVLLREDVVSVAVQSRDTRPDFRALSLFDRSGLAVRVTRIDGEILDAIEDAETGIGVFAARAPLTESTEEWTFDPSIDRLESGWQAVLIGQKTTLGEIVPGSSDGTGVIKS